MDSQQAITSDNQQAIASDRGSSVVRRPSSVIPVAAGFDRPLLLVALLLTVVVLAYFWTPTDPDVWWHLRNGQIVVTTGMVPQGDIYSYTVPGARWIMQQWLLESVMYAIEEGPGYWANVLLFGLVSAAVYAILFSVLRAQGAGRLLAALAMAGAMVLDAPSWGVRPQIWTTLFFAGFLTILLRYRRVTAGAPVAAGGLRAWIGPDRALWLLPPLMLLWANVHAGFTAGLLLLGAFVAGEAGSRLLRWPASAIRPLVAVSVACAAASLVNPNGLDLWLYPITYLSGPSGNASLRFVQEWQPLDLRSLRAAPFTASLLFLLALGLVQGAGVRGRGPGTEDDAAADGDSEQGCPASRLPGVRRAPRAVADLALIFALVGVTLMAFQALRFVPLYGVIWAVVAGRRVAELWPRLGRGSEPGASPATEAARQRRFARLNTGVYAVTTLVVAGVMLTNPRAQVHAAPLEQDYPAGAVAYLASPAQPLPRPLHLFHEYGWGGYLIAHHWPVFVDGRADPYNTLLDDYVAAISGVRWPAIFARYGVNAVLIRPGAPLAQALQTAPGWRLAYQDAGAVLYISVGTRDQGSGIRSYGGGD